MDFRGGLGRGMAWSPVVARKWTAEMEDSQISSLTLGIFLGLAGSAILLSVSVFCVTFLYMVIVLANILLLARFIALVIKPVVKIVTNNHLSLLSQMRVIFFLILSSDGLFFEGLVFTIMASGILILEDLVSGVEATTHVGLSSLAVAFVLTMGRIITVFINEKP